MPPKRRTPEKANEETLLVTVPAISFRWLRVELIGESPLLTNRFSDQTKQEIETKQQGGARTKKKPRNPDDECESAAYSLGKGTYGFRAIGLKKAMATAGMRFADGKKTELNGAFFVDGPHGGLIEVVSKKPTRGDDMVILQGKTATIAYRPYFFPWKMKVEIKYIPNFITRDQLINLLQLAGQCVSIGSWRVEKGGDKGLFRVGKVEEIRRAA